MKEDNVTAFIDIKMDLGWNREGLIDLCKKHYQTVLSLRNQECQLKDGQTKIHKKLNIAQKISYNIVIISGKNISAEKLTRQLKEAGKFKPDVNVFVLSAGVHPNSYDITSDNLIKQVDVGRLEASCANILSII